MKKLIGIVLSLTLLAGVGGTAYQSQNKEVVVCEPPVKTIVYLTDADFSKLYSCHTDIRRSNDSIVEVTQKEAWALMKLAKAEHGNSDDLAQAYVIETVLNRVDSEDFPDSILEVISQDGQFSTVSDGSYDEAIPDWNSHRALYLVESGQIDHEALYFEANWATDTWQSQNREFLFEYKGTVYYK